MKHLTSQRWFAPASQVLAVLLFLLVWHLFSVSDLAEKAGAPGPLPSFVELVLLFGVVDFWAALGWSVLSWLAALVIAVAIGIPLGIAIGRNRRALDSTKWTIDLLRTLPGLALIPVALLLFGASVTMAVIIGAFTAVWPLIVQSISAAEHADPVLHRVARSFRLSNADRIRFVLAPDTLAFIWPGLRIAVTASLLSTIGAQLIGGAPGLGLSILDAQIANQQPAMYAYVITACFLGLLINGGLALLQRRLLWWHPSMRGVSS